MTKLAILTIAAMLALPAAMTAANAVEFDVGPGGVRVGPRDHGERYYRSDRDDCRIIIRHHTNRFGEDVVVRDRVCD